MKSTIIILSIVLNLNSVWAVDLSQKDQFNHNWSYTPTFTRTDKNSVLKVKMFKRYLWINQKPIQVAETNFTFLKNPQEKIDLKSLSETIKKSFPAKTLTAHTISNGIELSGHWSKINRYIKMDLIKKGDDFIVVTTFARSGLSKALMPELNQLHSLLKTYSPASDSEKKTPKTTFLNYFIPEAHAAPPFGVPDLSGLLNSSNVTTGNGTNFLTTNSNVNVSGNVNSNVTLNTGADINTNWSNTNNNLSGLNNNLTDMNANVGNLDTNVNTNWGNSNTIMDKQGTEANKNWADSNKIMDKQGTDANKNWADSNTIMDKQGTEANKNWADTNKLMDKQGTEANKNWQKSNEVINTNWAESNRIAAQMMDPNHMAKVAYYTAAGAALGAITMNLAVEGISAGISILYELFTGTKKKKLEWQDFQQAMQSWDNQLNDLVKMEQIVDEFIAAFDFFGDKDVSNDYIKNLNIAMRDMRFDRDIMMAQFKNEELNLGCRRVFYNAADELDQKLKEYDKIIQFATKNNISINKNQNYFCQQLKELQRKILSSETQMQDLRLAILKAENQFYDKNIESREKREKNANDVNDNVDKTIANRKQFNQASTDAIKESFEKERDEWVSQCVAAENPEGVQIKADIDNRFLHFFKAKGRCRTAFDSTHSLKDRETKAQKVFAAENKLRQDLVLKSNTKIDVELSEEQMNWLTRIHMDAYCYQFAHEAADKLPVKCKEFPELLYSMNMSKGYEKAKGAYKDRCEDRYLNGIRKLAGKD